VLPIREALPGAIEVMNPSSTPAAAIACFMLAIFVGSALANECHRILLRLGIL
jgi:hypothetical protein